MILCLKSVISLYEKYILTCHLDIIPVYRLNQDHIELFFCLIRSKSGFNNNPTVRQFIASYKRLLVHTQLEQSNNGNCISQEALKILSASSYQPKKKTNELCTSELEVLSESDNEGDSLNDYCSNVVQYVAGYVVHSSLKKLRCEECLACLTSEANVNNLISLKNRGGLKNPSNAVIQICSITEMQIRYQQKLMGKKFKLSNVLNSKIYNYVIKKISPAALFESHTPHKATLVRMVLNKYLRVRFFYLAKCTKNQISLRRKNTKITIFQGT